MSVLLRNILAVVCGVVLGSAANMALVWLAIEAGSRMWGGGVRAGAVGTTPL